MNVYYTTDALPHFRDPVVTVGSFDGMHHGHRVILDRVLQRADETGGESVVVTFSPHPRQVLPRGGEVKLLSTLPEKIHLLSDAGIDNLVVLPFNGDMAALSSDGFVRDILVGKIGLRYLVVGYDHRFGRDQSGDYELLRKMGAELGFLVERVEKHLVDDHKVSSTVLRDTIQDGDMALASELLSHDYIAIADIGAGREVVKEESKLFPPRGKYPVTLHFDNYDHHDMLSIDAEGQSRLEKGCGDANLRGVLITFDGK